MKKVVTYDISKRAEFFLIPSELADFEDNGPVMVGEVFGLNHPRIPTGRIRTSRVIYIDPLTGVFETLNTVYKPKEEHKNEQIS